MAAVYAVAPRPSPLDSNLSQAGPSSASQSSLKKRPSLQTISPSAVVSSVSAKRKRNDTPDDTSADSASGLSGRKPRDGPKKKKASRACYHCQKAHLTCDDSRPCQRCTKRGLAHNCTEGHRKKAKYLLDEEELEQLKRTSPTKATDSQSTASATSTEPPTIPIAEPFPQNEPILTSNFDPSFSFGSEAANLEYSILSAILGNPSPPESSTTPPPADLYSAWNSDTLDLPSSSASNAGATYENQMSIQQPYDTSLANPNSNPAHYLTYPFPSPQRASLGPADLTYSASYSSTQTPTPAHPLQPRFPVDPRPKSPPAASIQPPASRDAPSRGLLSPPDSAHSPSSTVSAPAVASDMPASKWQTINDRVTVPYDYTEGYHFLMKYLRTRFEKNDILRIVRALAIFRPSLIALQMPLSLDDEIFVEKCFQRSLLELEKLISYSGTPTVVWRRTGEICLVAPEFCMLTEWPLEDLVGNGRKKYIYELFENQSTVEYWENFASHAFENTTQSVYSHCVLLKPSGAPVPSTFCFSIRRDLFDLPSMVIGQWLPLL
ncbi:hypothetical protein CPB83DRAFT_869094 [Crepidotus variabilis]|uniref:Transcription activator of gluconeogenesis ERT1 n=1 Tax=Crepidotus variabilis TaxID=179855 RepID=A0A9P6EHJ8_9AGAR|nr:hypothetical protein CPB83DRAFT_869094 [Crepidotus variabilis]